MVTEMAAGNDVLNHIFCGGTAVTRDSTSASTASSGVRRSMRWLLESIVIAIMIKTFARFYDSAAHDGKDA
jgi:hypothetical protein